MTWTVRRTNHAVGENPAGPALSPEELTGNLSLLERQLNREMKCTAGKNQVFIRSLVSGRAATRPRIALKCFLRRDLGLAPEVFFEQIKSLCCGDPEQCEAWQAFKKRQGR